MINRLRQLSREGAQVVLGGAQQVVVDGAQVGVAGQGQAVLQVGDVGLFDEDGGLQRRGERRVALVDEVVIERLEVVVVEDAGGGRGRVGQTVACLLYTSQWASYWS